MSYFNRLLDGLMRETLKTRSLVYLNGARQCGKSTLAQNISVNQELNYITFDNPASLAFAKSDPSGFIQHLPAESINIIDEVQLAPELFRHFKIAADKSRLPEKSAARREQALYVLTGSANIFALPKLADALVGRMSILTLYPFSASEINKTGKNFLQSLFTEELVTGKYPSVNIADLISSATFPEIAINKKTDRFTWFNDYITAILQRDVRTLADIRNPENIYRLLVAFAMNAGSLLNNSGIMSHTGIDAKTYEKYKALCHCAYLTFELPSWSKPNKLNKRFVRQKKLYFTDTNLLCHLMQRDIKEIYKNDRTTMGHIFENFIATEIMKAASSLGSYSVSHFNPVQYQGKEVDFVVESPNGKTIGIEVKLNDTIKEKDWANMFTLQETIGSRSFKGIVVYTGNELIQTARNIWAVPAGYLIGIA